MRAKSKKGEVSTSPFYLENLKIEKLAVGGAGIARASDGRVVFVQATCPGDVVKAQVTKDKKNFLEAKLVSIVTPSPERVEAPCSVASTCGGCVWQHVSQKEQLNQKQIIVEDTLKKFLRDIPLNVLPIIPSPKNFRYRNRIQPKIHEKKFGFYQKNSHNLVEISDCLITEEIITREFSKIHALASQENLNTTLEIYLDQKTDDVRWRQIDNFDDGIGFSQVNRFQNSDLIKSVLDYTSQISFEEAYDLYAGSGNFTFPLADSHPNKSITAVELSQKLVSRGQENTESRHQIKYFCSDVELFLQKSPPKANDFVLLDPPRSGCSPKVMELLASAQPRHLVYISCHPVSLARDLQNLFLFSKNKEFSYKIVAIQPFEMFPQTDHMETIVFLTVDT